MEPEQHLSRCHGGTTISVERTARDDGSSGAAVVLVSDPSSPLQMNDVPAELDLHDDIFVTVCADSRIELRLGGMAFDLVPALADAGFEDVAFNHRIEVPNAVRVTPQSARFLVPAPHIASGKRSMPVIREWLGLAARLVASMPQVAAVGWTPASLLMDRDYFCSHIGRWIRGGMFPASVVSVLTPSLGEALQSEGMAFFNGQELRLEGSFTPGPATADRLAQRVLGHLAHHGPLSQIKDFLLPEGGTMRLEPSPNGRFVRAYLL
ncbi:hypothetical protein F7D01_14165 [Erythrobacter sp. 3-20A1M]|uniref:hypothetical protein n=1 Tax=Erythrobacter sp. 3-20A1M TaxID=2653850 RepID=UPI001BFC2ED5|nr:hypothetical protein [Erythrobacter sp. 3-20A1M]QWC58054.1 hypothetical protein F7D01_14165 [Erythrobacter sp. 3-20A1M]